MATKSISPVIITIRLMKYFVVLFVLHIPGLSDAQQLKVGDSMPDYQLVNLINHPAPTAKLSDFKKRLVILDFWSTTCLSCIESWPKLLKLQHDMQNDIQIILVNAFQNEDPIRKIFAKRKAAGVDVMLPTVCRDTILSKMFPRSGVPHVVWIDNGKIRAITDGSPLIQVNLQRMLSNPEFTLPQAYTEEARQVNFKKPLFIENNGGSGESIIRSSVLGAYGDNMVSNIALIGDNTRTRFTKITAINTSIIDLYGFAYSDRMTWYGEIYPMTENRILFEGIDSSEFRRYKDGVLATGNHYLYQLISPETTGKDLLGYMREDLYRYFGYEARIEKRKMKCRELKVEDSTLIARKPERVFTTGITKSSFNLNGAFYFKEIKWYLDEVYKDEPTPVLYDTKMKGIPANVQIETDITNPDLFDRALRQYGMSFKAVTRSIDVLVIRKHASTRRQAGSAPPR